MVNDQPQTPQVSPFALLRADDAGERVGDQDGRVPERCAGPAAQQHVRGLEVSVGAAAGTPERQQALNDAADQPGEFGGIDALLEVDPIANGAALKMVDDRPRTAFVDG